VAGAEYAHEWVPGRNIVFVSLAIAWAEAHGYHAVALGNNLEEGGGYPDNTELFTDHLNQASALAVQAHYGMRVLAPVSNLMKREIVGLGLKLDAPLTLTWSCYRGGEIACGHCGPCAMRRWAFERNGVPDPLTYAHEVTT
jgi:7-cyano-7-deazaguanine synthase